MLDLATEMEMRRIYGDVVVCYLKENTFRTGTKTVEDLVED